MALSMFGFFEIQFFQSLQNKVSNVSTDSYFGVFLFGIGLPLTNITIDNMKCQSQTMWFYMVPFGSLLLFLLFDNQNININQIIGLTLTIGTLLIYSSKKKTLKQELNL